MNIQNETLKKGKKNHHRRRQMWRRDALFAQVVCTFLHLKCKSRKRKRIHFMIELSPDSFSILFFFPANVKSNLSKYWRKVNNFFFFVFYGKKKLLENLHLKFWGKFSKNRILKMYTDAQHENCCHLHKATGNERNVLIYITVSLALSVLSLCVCARVCEKPLKNKPVAMAQHGNYYNCILSLNDTER